MAKRQAHKQRDDRLQQQRLIRRVGMLAVIVGIGASLMASLDWLSDPAHLPVRNLRLQGGMQHLDQQQMRQAVLPYVQGGLLGVDVEQVRTAVEAMPWVLSATVRRSWPDTLVINVREQEAMARWRDGGYVSSGKERFIPAQADDTSLPLLGGPEGSEGMLVAYYQDLSVLTAPLGLQITELEMDERRAWRMQLSNGIEVMLGREAFETRMARFLRHYSRVVRPEEEKIVRVDMRYTNGFSIRWLDQEESTGIEGRGETNV